MLFKDLLRNFLSDKTLIKISHFYGFLVIQKFYGMKKADSLSQRIPRNSQFIEWISPEDVIANLKTIIPNLGKQITFSSKYYDLIGNFPDIGTITKMDTE
ncbi:hypothetical protein CEXT_579961 [Caerostris extrusa]|uniref:Uncharacterized protein n=1 Tax=Caerostris extrusa TaxID=172846 RepID=A0AAV4UPV1_CAEEX|nr:hypothetical protein CEXT_579961 [Caerostris extrusa]